MKPLLRLLAGAAIVLAAATTPVRAAADIGHLLPQVKHITVTEGAELSLARPITVTDPTATATLTELLSESGATFAPGGTPLTVEITDSIPGAFRHDVPGYQSEEYSLAITPQGITVRAVTAAGVTRAAQTLAQLAIGRDGSLPCVEVADWPAFGLRGFMHDVGRSFISVATLKRHIDELSRFKINTFFWHLTENQAWRFEVKKYPQLTSAESMTRFPGNFYTQDECSDVARYAADRGVTVIPEIDMPGHSAAFERAMGFAMSTDSGVAVLKDVLAEAARVFPHAPYIHIGADETHVTAGFINTMADYVSDSLGREVIVWNPMANGMDIDRFDNIGMTAVWRHGVKAGGKRNVDFKFKYLNLTDCFADLFGIWRGEIYREPQGTDEVTGAAAAVWNDRRLPSEEDIAVQNNLFAATAALAERTWAGGGYGYPDSTGVNMPPEGEIRDAFAEWEKRFLTHKHTTLAAERIPYVGQSDIRWRITEPMPNGGNPERPLGPEATGVFAKSYDADGAAYSTVPAAGAAVYLMHTWHERNISVPALFGPIPDHTAYAFTCIYSPLEQDAGALMEFHNYGRSEDDCSPLPGRWDRKGSRAWLNGTEIPAPEWTGRTDTGNQDMERPLGNENLTARPPVAIHLRKGWNRVLLRLPFRAEPEQVTRLDHWYFTFVVTDPDGRDALPGIIYDPDACTGAENGTGGAD